MTPPNPFEVQVRGVRGSSKALGSPSSLPCRCAISQPSLFRVSSMGDMGITQPVRSFEMQPGTTGVRVVGGQVADMRA
jgi:hypothetical protein